MGSTCSNYAEVSRINRKKDKYVDYKPIYSALVNCYDELFLELAEKCLEDGWKSGRLFKLLSLSNCDVEDRQKMFLILIDLDIDKNKIDRDIINIIPTFGIDCLQLFLDKYPSFRS